MAISTLVFLLVAGCATVTDQQLLGVEENWEYTVRRNERRGQKKSTLTYKNRTVGTYYSAIVVGNRRFQFNIATGPEELAGYGISQIEPSAVDSALPAMTEEEIKDGWYLAERQKLRPGTPEDWIWVERENLKAWINPRSLTRLANRYDVGPILRGKDAEGSRISVGIGVTTKVKF
jgi:hypothetical protein